MNKRVKELQKFLGVSDERFCKTIGIEQELLNQIVDGKITVPEQIANSICSKFGVAEECQEGAL